MLSIVMFILGVVLLNRGKVQIPFLKIAADGSAVRTAGIVLMLPLGCSIILGFYVGMTSGGDLPTMYNTVQSVAILELVAIISAAAAAYVILKRNEVPFTSENHNQPQEQSPEKPARPPHPLETAPAPSRLFQTAQPQTFPRVMSLHDAARYLNISEQRVLEAINDGQIPAARNNGVYTIARIVLDEFRDNNNLQTSAR